MYDRIVSKEWPDAQLYVYGSCANSFGFWKSDIDICLAIEDANVDKSEVLLNLADMLQSDNLQNVQGMEATYSVSVDNIECAYFDKVEKLYGFGFYNGESLARLVWAFFKYWAYCHDYANDVISVLMGSTVRHLLYIKDPFEVSHDLGWVVDKFSIRVLRKEFERAAEIMQYDPNPWVKLFEPYIRS